MSELWDSVQKISFSQRFLQITPHFENKMQRDGIILLKYWLEVSSEEQEQRFRDRIEDPRKQWKLSPIDLEARRRCYDYSRARDAMMEATDTESNPWHIVPSDDKESAWLNCISHMLAQIPYEPPASFEPVNLPPPNADSAYDDKATMAVQSYVPPLF